MTNFIDGYLSAFPIPTGWSFELGVVTGWVVWIVGFFLITMGIGKLTMWLKEKKNV